MKLLSQLFFSVCTLHASLTNASSPSKAELDAIVAHMSLEHKVGQLLMVGFGGTQINSIIKEWVHERKVGGVALFGRNIVDLPQTLALTRDLHSLAEEGVPLFLSLDQEGGNVVRVKDGATVMPGNMALGATRSPILAYVAGQVLGIDLRRLGFNMNLAPVLDVNSNPENPVIGIRSFAERADLVGKLGTWLIRGQQQVGVVSVAKHFPGHGDTKGDSHVSIPVVNAGLEELEKVELEPFREAIAAGLDAVMTAHIAVPEVTGDARLPATLSSKLLTEQLRGVMGFEGIVLTDGLEMRAITDQYKSHEAAVMAINAGADMVLVLWRARVKEDVFNALLTAARTGVISEERLNASVRRILRVKARRQLFDRKYEAPAKIVADRNRNRLHQLVAERIAAKAVTIVRNRQEVLPVTNSKYGKVVVVAPPGEFARTMAREKFVKLVKVPIVPNRKRREADIRRVRVLANGADVLVFAVQNRYHVKMAQRVRRMVGVVPIVVVSMASPYYLTSVPFVDGYVCTYSYRDVAQSSVAEVVLGRAPAEGSLPVSIPGFYSYGDGRDGVATAMRVSGEQG